MGVTHLFGHSEATLNCNYGYTPSSYGATISCTNDRWGTPGTCVAGSPPPPVTNPFAPPPPPPPTSGAGQCNAVAPTVANGAYMVTHLFGHSEATLNYNYGYTPSSYGATISCTNDRWGTPGTCVAGSPSPPATNPF